MAGPFLPAGLAAQTWYDIADLPIGTVALTGDGRALTGLYLLGDGRRPGVIRPQWRRKPGLLPAVTAQLAEYFAGTRTAFDLPLAPQGTPFQLAVWAELTRIPYGTTVSYGDVAAALGRTAGAARAVGAAGGRNPIPVIVPCHRVIGADGSLTGFGWGIERKQWLLRHESALASDSQGALFG